MFLVKLSYFNLLIELMGFPLFAIGTYNTLRLINIDTNDSFLISLLVNISKGQKNFSKHETSHHQN